MLWADAAPEVIHQRLTTLRNGLLRLHKRLLDSEAALYDREVSRITSSGHLLDLVLNHPSFAWLRELSQLVVVIDERLDEEAPVSAVEAERLMTRVRALLSPSEFGDGFQRSYFDAFQRDPETVLAHAEMMKVFHSLS